MGQQRKQPPWNHLERSDLTLHNNGCATWRNWRYATHIDLTLSNDKLAGRLKHWKAGFEISSTDHALCRIDLANDRGELVQKVKRTNTKAFKEDLASKEWDPPKKWMATRIDWEAEKLTCLIKEKWEQYSKMGHPRNLSIVTGPQSWTKVTGNAP